MPTKVPEKKYQNPDPDLDRNLIDLYDFQKELSGRLDNAENITNQGVDSATNPTFLYIIVNKKKYKIAILPV
jgi:hypothetical protein